MRRLVEARLFSAFVVLCFYVFALVLAISYPRHTVHAQIGQRVTFTSATLVDMQVTPGPDYLLQCFDGSGFWFQPQSVQVVNSTLIEIKFSTPTSGRCVAK